MVRNYTTLEESKHLVELGVSTDTADMCYALNDDVLAIPYNIVSKDKDFPVDGVIPCWSLSALLELMPKSINKYDGRVYRNYSINLFRSYYYCCGYSFGPSLNEENQDNLCIYGSEDCWLDGVYHTILWLFDEGYLKKEE